MSNPDPAIEAKKSLRASARYVRAQAFGETEGAGLLLLRPAMAFLNRFEPGTLSAYYPFETEIDCLPLLGALRERRWRVGLPVAPGRGRPLEFRLWAPGEPLATGPFGILAPPDCAETVMPDVFLVPMLAFDRRGYRLGYGGGYYDRTLALARTERTVSAVGLAFDAQRVDRCPVDDYDQPLDAIITETGPVDILPARGET